MLPFITTTFPKNDIYRMGWGMFRNFGELSFYSRVLPASLVARISSFVGSIENNPRRKDVGYLFSPYIL